MEIQEPAIYTQESLGCFIMDLIHEHNRHRIIHIHRVLFYQPSMRP